MSWHHVVRRCGKFVESSIPVKHVAKFENQGEETVAAHMFVIVTVTHVSPSCKTHFDVLQVETCFRKIVKSTYVVAVLVGQDDVCDFVFAKCDVFRMQFDICKTIIAISIRAD